MRLTALYGQLFISKHGEVDKGVWLKVLHDLTPKALESGIERLMSLSHGKQFCEFPPNALQFRALCLGFYEDLRLPLTSDAYREIRMKAYIKSDYWSHLAVRFTAHKLGQNFLNEKDDAKTYAVFKTAYEQVCHLVRQGLPVPEVIEPLMVLPPKTPSIAKQHLNQIRQMLGAAL
jgi:hypothetical protein